MPAGNIDMTDVDSVVDGGGSYEYLTRSLAIVTLLYERGILQDLIAEGKITQEEIDLRVEAIREKYNLGKGQASADPDQD